MFFVSHKHRHTVFLVGVLFDFVSHKVMLRHLLLHLCGLLFIAHRGVFDLLPNFCSSDYLQRIVDIALQRINQAGILFQLTVPEVHQGQTLFGKFTGQSEFHHLDSRSNFHYQAFLFGGILRRSYAILHHHALTCQSLLMTGGAYHLSEHFLHIVVVVGIVVLRRHIDGILLRFVMRHATTI